jgi:DNA-binding transcriptional LysR family regulator
MTLQQVLDFLCIAEHGSVHAASRASGQSQPALTKSLHRLEQTLGAPLFDRHARGTRINAFGREFLDHARRIAAEAQRAREAMAQSLGQRHGRVEYGISAAAAGWADRLRDLPDAPAGDRCAALQQRAAAKPDGAGGPAGMPGGGIYSVFERAGWGTPRVDLRTNNLIDTVALVSGSDCLALVPEVLMQSGLLRERLAALPVEEALPAYAVALFQRAEVALTSAARSLAAQFEREAHYRVTQGSPGVQPHHGAALFTSTA